MSLYHDHGTSEPFHSELKTDLDVERFPSGKFSKNDLILHLGCNLQSSPDHWSREFTDTGCTVKKKSLSSPDQDCNPEPNHPCVQGRLPRLQNLLEI